MGNTPGGFAELTATVIAETTAAQRDAFSADPFWSCPGHGTELVWLSDRNAEHEGTFTDARAGG